MPNISTDQRVLDLLRKLEMTGKKIHRIRISGRSIEFTLQETIEDEIDDIDFRAKK